MRDEVSRPAKEDLRRIRTLKPLEKKELSLRLSENEKSVEDACHQYVVPGYTLVETVARGASGTVFVGHSQLDGTTAAIKIFDKKLVPDREAMNRFEREVEALKRLKHPNIVRITGYGTTENKEPFIGMELIDGVSIRTMLETDGVFEPRRAAQIARDVCRALESAHSQSLIHRDLKPSNIVIDRADVARVVDFGLAKAAGCSTETITVFGALIGTPSYMSPEQCMGQKVDPRTDIYALGCTLLEMITGTKAFDGSPVEAIAKQISKDRRHLKNLLLSSGAPIAFRRIISKCLELNPDNRYNNASELDHDLASFLLNIPPQFTGSGTRRARKWMPACAGLAVTGLIVWSIINFLGTPGDSRPTTQFYETSPSDRMSIPKQHFLVNDFLSEARNSGSPQRIEIRERNTHRIIYTDAYAYDLKDAVIDASSAGRSLAGADLRNANLENLSLSGLDLSGADLSGANLIRSKFTNTNLSGANLENAELSFSTLQHVNLQRSNLKGAKLGTVKAAGINLNFADLNESQITDGNFEAATCVGTDFSNAIIENTSLAKSDCDRANFFSTKLTNVNFEDAKIDSARFNESRLKHSPDFENTDQH